MRTQDLVATAISNTFRSKLRTTLTVLAIFVGAFTLTLTNAVGAGVSQYVDAQVGSLGSPDVFIMTQADETASADDGPVEYDPNGSAMVSSNQGPPGTTTQALTDADLTAIGDAPGIESVDPVRSVQPDFIENRSGTGPNKRFEFSINATSAVTTADLTAGAQLNGGTREAELVLPDTYVAALGFDSANDAVGASVTIGITDILGEKHTVEATVVGVSRESLLAAGAGANDALIAELAEAQSGGIDTAVTSYGVAIAHFDESLTSEQITALKADLATEGYTASTIEDQLGAVQTVITGIVGVLNAFAVIALIAAAFGIINTLLMSVQERTREIGLMKAMGMSGGKVYTLFSLEAIVIGFLGSAIGAGVAIGLGSILSNVLADGLLSGLPGLNILLFEPASVAFVIALVMLIAFLSGTLPAQRAAKQNPIESLRYE